MPIFPQVPPAPPSDPWLQMLSGLDQSEVARKAEIANLYGGLNSLFEGMLGDVNSRPAPEQQAIPAGTSPLGAMAATFAAALSDQLGRRDSATQNVQRTLAGQQEEQAAIKQQNTAMLNADMRDRQMQRVQLQMKIAETKMQQAKELGDVDEFYKHLKTQIQSEKYMQKLRQEGDMDLEKLRQSGRMKELKLKDDLDPENDPKVITQKQTDDALAKLQAYVQNVQKAPGNVQEKGDWVFGLGPRSVQWTPKGQKEMRTNMETRLRSTPIPAVQTATAIYWIDTFKNKEGLLDYSKLGKETDWKKLEATLTDMRNSGALSEEALNELRLYIGQISVNVPTEAK